MDPTRKRSYTLTSDDQYIADQLPRELVLGYTRLAEAFDAAAETYEQVRQQRITREAEHAQFFLKKDCPKDLLQRPFDLDPGRHVLYFTNSSEEFVLDEASGACTATLESILDLCYMEARGVTASQFVALQGVLLGSEAEKEAGSAALEANPLRFGDRSCCCMRCGFPLTFRFDGKRLSVDETCAFGPDWKLEIEIDVPSGRLYVGPDVQPLFRRYGDLRVYHPSASAEDRDEEAVAAIDEEARAYAAMGCAVLRVGAAQPLWYADRGDPGRFTIARARDPNDAGVPTHLKRIRAIKKDLGSIYIADLDLVRQRWKGSKPPFERYVVEVPPGRYRFTHHVHTVGFKKGWRGEPYRCYTDVERIGPAYPFPAPPERTAGQVWQHALDQDRPVNALDYARFPVLERIFAKPQTRGRWRPEGYPQFLRMFPETTPEAELPPLNTMIPFVIEPDSAIFGIVDGTIPANLSMRAFARRFLACVAEHGVIERRYGQWLFNHAVCAQQRALAKELLAAFDARYPSDP